MWSRFHAGINGVADNFFYRLGFWVANHTKTTLLISFVFVVLCCFGFANFTVEYEGGNIWLLRVGVVTAVAVVVGFLVVAVGSFDLGRYRCLG